MGAVELMEYINQNDIKIIAPEFLITETLNVCMTKGVIYQNVIDFWELQCSLGLLVVTADEKVLVKACRIAEYGHEKSGYPSFNDSLYHAIALNYNTTFITADQRHIAKVEKF